jgi:hypothetical protein
MKWQFVFNGDLKHWGNIDDLTKTAKQCGYKFVTFNGLVYTVDVMDTGFTTSDLI